MPLLYLVVLYTKPYHTPIIEQVTCVLYELNVIISSHSDWLFM